MNEKKYLPIGTVCRLKNGKKNLMIIGFSQSSTEDPEKSYDYAGCLYPEGIISSEINFLFNHNQIEQILYKGFVNEEEIKFKNRLNEFLTTGKIDGQIINFDSNGNIIYADKDISYQDAISTSQLTPLPPLNTTNIVNQQQSVQPTLNTLNTLNLNQQNNN